MGPLKIMSFGVQGVTYPGWINSQNGTVFDWGKSQAGHMGKESP